MRSTRGFAAILVRSIRASLNRRLANMTLSATYKRHLAAINGDAVTKSNIIGLRKAFNAQARKDQRLSVSSVSPNITADEIAWLQNAIAVNQPRVIGDLHDSGLKLLQGKRYRNRFTEGQKEIIDSLDHFRLAGFEWIDSLHCVPVYRAIARDGRKFLFRNVAWQSGGNGPEIFV
jgi:hypothetical protein